MGNWTNLIIPLVILIFAIIVVARSVVFVPQSRMRIVERLGKYRRTLDPGPHLVVPVRVSNPSCRRCRDQRLVCGPIRLDRAPTDRTLHRLRHRVAPVPAVSREALTAARGRPPRAAR